MKEALSKRIANFSAKTSLTVAKSSANTVCFMILNQPKLPEKVKQLRKF